MSALATAAAQDVPSATSKDDSGDGNEVVARRIVVTGDVQGGYYRSCVLNEVRRLRRFGPLTEIESVIAPR